MFLFYNCIFDLCDRLIQVENVISVRLLKYFSKWHQVKVALLHDIVHGKAELALFFNGASFNDVHSFDQLKEVNGSVLGFSVKKDENIHQEWMMLYIRCISPELIKLAHVHAFTRDSECSVHGLEIQYIFFVVPSAWHQAIDGISLYE